MVNEHLSEAARAALANDGTRVAEPTSGGIADTPSPDDHYDLEIDVLTECLRQLHRLDGGGKFRLVRYLADRFPP